MLPLALFFYFSRLFWKFGVFSGFMYYRIIDNGVLLKDCK